MIHADGNRRDGINQRGCGNHALGQHGADRIVQGNIRAGDAGSAGTAVGLDHVAVNLNGVFAQFGQIDHGAQAAANQALDFLGATGLFTFGGFTRHAAAGGARQHAVFGGYPAFARALFMRWDASFDAGGANHFGVAAFNQHRAFGVFGVVAGNADGAELVGGALTWAHGVP